MNNSFTIDYEKALVSVGTIESSISQVRSGFDSMRDEVNSKIGTSVWSGTRANEFKSKWEEFATNFDACISQLETVRAKVEAAHQTYLQLDQGSQG